MPIALSAKQLPKIAVLGHVVDVADPKPSKSHDYAILKVSLAPLNPKPVGRIANRDVYLSFRPEWFKKGFDPNKALNKNAKFVFSRNVRSAADEQLSALEALAGTVEDYDLLDQHTQALDEYSIDSVGNLLRDFILTEKKPFIYILQQQREGTGVQGDDGKEIKVLGRYYEVGEFLRADATGRRKVENKLKYAQDVAAKASKEQDEVVEPLFQIGFELELLPEKVAK